MKMMTKFIISGTEGGIAITPVAKAQYHPLLQKGEATEGVIGIKAELRKISEKYHFLIVQLSCLNSLQICIMYDIHVYTPQHLKTIQIFSF